MPKHTPGPWTAERQNFKSLWSEGLPQGATVITSLGTACALGVSVAATPGTNPADDLLIQAAPTMLEALYQVREWLMQTSFDPKPPGHKARWEIQRIVYEAIADATDQETRQ